MELKKLAFNQLKLTVNHTPTADGKTETPINGVCRDDPTARCTMGHSIRHTLLDHEIKE